MVSVVWFHPDIPSFIYMDGLNNKQITNKLNNVWRTYVVYVGMHASATLFWLLVQWLAAAYLFLRAWISCRVTQSLCTDFYTFHSAVSQGNKRGCHSWCSECQQLWLYYLYKGKEGGGRGRGKSRYITRYHMVMDVSTYRATAIKACTLENLQRNELLMEAPVVPAWSKLYSHWAAT